MTNEAFREKLIQVLERDIALHETGKFDQIGADFDEVDGARPLDAGRDLAIAWNFWEDWSDEAGHGFQGFYRGIKKEDWPVLAKILVEDLKAVREVSDPRIVGEFNRLERKIATPWWLVVPALIILVSGILWMIGSFISPREPDNRHPSTRAMIAKIAANVRAYRNECSEWPESIEEMVLQPCEKFRGFSWRYVPQDLWGNPFSYKKTESGALIMSFGADRKPGGEGHNQDLEERVGE